jgi:hypothetical protein
MVQNQTLNQAGVNIEFVAHVHYFHHKKIDGFLWFADA